MAATPNHGHCVLSVLDICRFMMTRLFFQDRVYHCVVLPRFKFSFQKNCKFLDLQEHLLGAPLVGDKTDAEGPVRLVGLPVPRWQYRTYTIF